MEADSDTEYQYAVIQFLTLPREDIGDLICVPYSWIRTRRATEGKSIVAYPNERPSVTQRRIQDKENPSDKWNPYMVFVKHETYTYKDANDYVLKKKYGVAKDNLCSSARTYGRKSSVKRAQPLESQSDTVMTKSRIVKTSNKNASGNILPTQSFKYPYLQQIPYYVGKIQDPSTELGCEDIVKEQSHISKDSLMSMKQHLENSMRLSNQNQFTNMLNQRYSKVSAASQVLPTQMIVEQSSTQQSKSRQLSVDKRSQDSDIQPMIVDESEASLLNKPQLVVTEDGPDPGWSCSDEPEVSSEQDDQSSSEASIDQEDQPVDSSVDKRRLQVNFIPNLIDKMENRNLNSSETILEVHKLFDQSVKLLQLIKDSYDSKKNQENQKKQAEVKNPDTVMRKDNDSKSSSSDSEDQDKSQEDKKAPKKTRNHSRNFVLPPEYDPKDTRWTLKYRKNNPEHGLIELVSGSNVFVDPIKLAHCKRMSKDCKTLARMLLAEIFSHSALTVCSLTGARANAFHNNGTYIRPGLDTHARVTMLKFVEDYARDKQWAAFDKQSVINSIRSRIQEIRSKHAQKE